MDLLPIVATLLCLCFVRAQCDAGSASPSPEHEQENQMLRSKVASLEDEISRRKEETSELESVVRDRTAQMATLVGDLELLQKLNLGDDESVMKANTHDGMLEKQIERLGNDLEDQIRKGESLEARAIEAERSLEEFGRKLEHAEKTNIDQKKKIQDLSDRLQYAEDKLSTLENEAKSKAEELAKVLGILPVSQRFSIFFLQGSMACFQVHGMWLPHWLSVRVLRYQKLVPVAKDHLDALRNTTAALASAVANCTSTAYRVCRDVIQACAVTAGGFADNYWQRFSQPYLSRIVAASEPHLSRASVVLEPYMRPATSAWRSLVSFTSEYHHQVQNGVKRLLEGNELLTPLSVSADKLAWITAPALLALPVLSIYKIVSAIVRYPIGKIRRGRTDYKDRQAGADLVAASRNAESRGRA
ncbi:uncharacterized protein LOC8072308 isoform X2 [Sorghum bicolor]|uniref:uncharacterized protein LOC8072308 isoform X2 n=1 Tax=Sorghum bicolor TaxID=4558 RepID=UPI000B425563|nr:uncharacterized protein LOC8072308 isoform X2 [Sorghum bicolor]|eukprot:XP_021318416.1 uncharacterized protein LOC8072308 isoform X2 [Sorghum bicolor]